MSDQLFSVKSVCQLTGLNEHTLRAWERRHAAVKPRRTDNGRRLYTTGDVERLRRMVQLGDKGHAISRICSLTDSELAQMLSRAQELDEKRDQQAMGVETLRRREEMVLCVGEIGNALAAWDLTRIHHDLTRARARFGAKAFVLELISPLMGQVGRLILEGRLSIGQEHALTAVVRAHLFDLLFELKRLGPRVTRGEGPSAQRVFAISTMEGDLHEIGIMISAVICADLGVQAHYIGPSMPPDALGEAATALNATCLLLGICQLPPGTLPRSHKSYLEILTKRLPASCEVWLGGRVDAEVDSEAIGRPVQMVKTLDGFEELLRG